MHSVQLVARVPADQAEALTVLASRNARSLSAELRAALASWIEEAPRRAAVERIGRMSRDELDAYLAGVVDGGETERARAREDERPASTPGVVTTPPVRTAEHGTAA